jgi:ribosomal protein S18 acetylase RimI-like enzyme
VRALALRRLSADDWPLWRALRLRALAEAPEAFGATLDDWGGEGDVEARWRARLVDVPLNLVAELDGEPVAMASGTAPAEDAVELISMWVAPEARDGGVGAALIRGVEEWAAAQGVRALALDVREANAHALALYAREGFVDVGPARESDPAAPERRMLKRLGA